MCNIANRLLEERKRLDLNQDQMAETGGIAKRTYCNYEAGDREPMASFFAAIAAAGADVQYILTGIRSSVLSGAVVLNREEAALLDNFRHIADQEDKSAVTKLALRSAEAATREETQPREKKNVG